MRTIIIGCTHSGTAAAVNLKKLYPECEIVVYESNDNVSFLSCGIALSISGVVTKTEKLFYNSPENLISQGIMMNMRHEVINVDFEAKTIKVKNLDTEEIKEDNYDKLVLTMGSWPVVPNIEGVNLENILLCKNYNHAKEIQNKCESVNNIVVVGAGYIGVELAEAFKVKGKNVTLIDSESRIMSKYLDESFTDIAENEFEKYGINLALQEKVKCFKGQSGKVTYVVTDKNEYEVDLVILCIGFAPNTKILSSKLKTLKNGAIVIDEYMQTSKKDVYAAGDCCAVKYNPTEDIRYIPLATNAVRMGTLVAKNIIKPTLKYTGTQGTSGIKIYNKSIAATGLTEEVAKGTTKYNVQSVTVTDHYRPEFMPTFEEATLKLVFDKDTRRILGGQIISDLDLTQFINTISLAIQNNMTVEELAITDFFFQPNFNKPWSLLNLAALEALKNN